MSQPLRVIGLEMSPYSLKVRSYLRYKQIPFEWIDRNRSNEALFQRHARVQLIPLVVFSDDDTMQDSTPIIERLEAEHPEPSIHPAEPAARFVSQLLEEYGDEWCNKLMFQYRWGPKVDARSAASRIASLMFPDYPLRALRPIMIPIMIRRMVPRMAFAGANETNAPHLERSWYRTVELLEQHLSNRPYLFGARPAFGDFGIWGNLNQAYTDPTCGEHLSGHAPALVRWIERMDTPSAEGDFEPLEELLPTLGPLLSEQVAGRFLPWTLENARALEAGEPQTRLEFDGELYEQKTFKYHAWSFGKLKEKLLPVAADPQLRAVLEETGCAPFLA
ncbi:MAG: glutathione S-transferase family protein [Deltaproteobacteria bacterium]|nr:glutathione S-transferase family protein [Deltaproteobacteria bacterium]